MCEGPIPVFAYLFSPESLSLQCKLELFDQATAPNFSFGLYLIAFCCTVLLETPFYFLALKKLSLPKKVVTVVGANLATHPVVNYLFPLIFIQLKRPYGAQLLSSEIFAITIEALILIFVLSQIANLSVGRAVILGWATSLAANLFSWSMGLVLFSFLSVS